MIKGERYREILRNKKGIRRSNSNAPATEFVNWLKSQPSGFEHKGKNFISLIKNGFVVRYKKWNNKLFDIHEMNGTLLFINENMKHEASVAPLCGTFKDDDKFDDIVKVHLREKKLFRVLSLFGEE